MRIVQDREDARGLPARFHFAIFKLAAFVRMKFVTPRERRGVLIVIDRDQSAVEHYIISAWITALVICFLSAIMPVILAIPLATIIIQIPLFTICRSNIDTSSWLMFTLVGIAAAYLLHRHTWIRFVALSYFLIIAINLLAAAIMMLLHSDVREMEARCGL